jgi:hypothetical protein
VSLDDVEIIHKIEARGTGYCTAETQSALAALVPADAHVSSHAGQNGDERYWTWSAEWDHAVDVDWRALPDEPVMRQPSVTILDSMMSDGTTERCMLLTPPYSAITGLPQDVAQCTRERNHPDRHLFDLSRVTRV